MRRCVAGLAVLCAVLTGCGEDPAGEEVDASGSAPAILESAEIGRRAPWLGTAGGAPLFVIEAGWEGDPPKWSRRDSDGTWTEPAAIPGLEPSGILATTQVADMVVVVSIPCAEGEPVSSDCAPVDHLTVTVFDGSGWSEVEAPADTTLSKVLAAEGELSAAFEDDGAVQRLHVANNAVTDDSAVYDVAGTDGSVTFTEVDANRSEHRCVNDDGQVLVMEKIPSTEARTQPSEEIAVDTQVRFEVTVRAANQRSASAEPVGTVGVLGWLGVPCTGAGAVGAGAAGLAAVTAEGVVELDTPLAASPDDDMLTVQDTGTGSAAVLWDSAGEQMVVVEGTDVAVAPIPLMEGGSVDHATVLDDHVLVLVRDHVILEHGKGAPAENAGREDRVTYQVVDLPLS